MTVRRPITVRANRDTLIVAALACALAVLLAHTQKREPETAPAAAPAAQEQWIGQLDDVALKADDLANAEPLTSASLVVPKADLALPQATKPGAKAAAKSCDGAGCTRPASGGARRFASGAPATGTHRARKQDDLLTQLNPLNHVPDAVRRPFVYAGNVVSGFFDRF